jgi:hypothetical protein
MAEAKGKEEEASAESGEDAPPPTVEVRFRTLAADGREVHSVPLELLRALPPPPRLGEPTFGHASYDAGDKASLFVRAEGVNKGAVKLIVEKQAGSAWETMQELSAPFQMGSASAQWTVPPQETLTIKARLRAVAPFGEKVSEPISLHATGLELTDPAWSHAHPQRGSHFDHGDEAEMQVTAKGMEGAQVRFVVEAKKGEAWEAYGTFTATVAGGVAKAKLTVRHPALAGAPKAAELQQAKPIELRFYAELAEQEG